MDWKIIATLALAVLVGFTIRSFWATYFVLAGVGILYGWMRNKKAP